MSDLPKLPELPADHLRAALYDALQHLADAEDGLEHERKIARDEPSPRNRRNVAAQKAALKAIRRSVIYEFSRAFPDAGINPEKWK